MADIIVFGGHGKVAMLTHPLLVAAGHRVTGVVRNPDHAADVEATGALALVADAETLDQPTIDQLVAGYECVVWSAGAGGGDPRRTRAVDRDAAIRVLHAAERASVRLVMVSYFGARPDHGVPADHPFHAYAEAKAQADEAIRASSADWVILGPSKLTFEAEGGIELDLDGRVQAGQIARATVARLIADVVDRPELNHVTLRCNDGSTAVDAALSAFVRP